MRILTGDEISRLAREGILFRKNFRESHCETMFYSLTLGHMVQSITRNEPTFHRLDAPLVMGPREAINAEIFERFHFLDSAGAPRYGGLIVARARMLAAGISHPATAVDPGANRATYLTLINHRSFPGPRLYPGKDKIAKMIIFQYEDHEELPQHWIPTEAYDLADEDEMPVFWPSPAEPWEAATQVTADDLRRLRTDYGAPYDQIACALEASIRTEDRLSDEIAHLSQTVKLHTVLSETLKDSVAALEAKADKLNSDVSFVRGEASTWSMNRVSTAEKELEKRVTRGRFILEIVFGFVIAVVAAALTILVTNMMSE